MKSTHMGQMREWSEERMIDVDTTTGQTVYVCRNHVRMSVDDWKEIKRRLVRQTKQGDMNHGDNETSRQENRNEAANVGYDPRN